jgi:tetratricopeptide (TPR) repeat protein
MKAMVDFFVAVYLLSEDRAARLAAAEAGSIKALSLAPDHALAHYCLGMVLGVTNRAEEGIAKCERALVIDRNLAGAHAVIGARKLFLGRAAETEAHVQEALRLSPRDTSDAAVYNTFNVQRHLHLRPNAPRASRCRDDHVADCSRSGLTIPEAPTLRAHRA